MEVQLQELIDQIKKEGSDAAKTETRSIVEAAGTDAEKILLMHRQMLPSARNN